MFIREIWGKFTSLIFRNFLKFFEISKFQKSELGKFIPNFPFKHMITSTNLKTFFIQIYLYPEHFCNRHVVRFFETVLKEVRILCPLSPQ